MKRVFHFSARALKAIFLTALILIVGIAIFLNSNAFDSLVREQIQTRLASAIKRKISVGSVAFNPLWLSIQLKDMKIENDPRSPDVPLFSAEEIYARVSWRQLLAGRIRISEIRLKKPLVSVYFYQEGGTNWPSFGKKEKKKKGGIDWIISRVDATDMTVILNEYKVPVSFNVKELRTHAEWDPIQKNYLSKTDFEDGYLRIKDYNFFKFNLRSIYRIIGDRVSFERLHFLSPRSKFWMRGEMYTPRSPFFDMNFRSIIDLSQAKEMFRLGPQMSGTGRFNAAYKGKFKAFRMKGTGQFNNFSFYSLPIDTAKFQLDMTDNSLQVTDINAQLFGGPYQGTFTVEPLKGHSVFRTDAKWRDWDGRLLGRFIQMNDMVLPVKASGSASLYWEEGASNQMKGDIRLRTEPYEGPGLDLAAAAENSNFDNALFANKLVLPFASETEFRLESRQLRNLKSKLQTLYTTAEIEGTIDFSGQADLNVVSHVEKIAEVDLLFHYLQSYFKKTPVALQEFWAVRGSADFNGKLDATVWSPFRPRLTGELTAKNILYHGVPWDSVVANVMFHDKLIEVSNSTLTLDNATAKADAKFFLGDKKKGIVDTMEAQATISNYPIYEIPHAFGMELPIRGSFNSTLELRGPFKDLEGKAVFEAFQGEMWGEKWDRATGTVLFFPDALGLRDIRAHLNGGYAQASGDLVYSDDSYTVDFLAENIPLERLNLLKQSGYQLRGIASARGSGKGLLSRPNLEGKITVSDLVYKEELYGNVESDIQLKPGILKLQARGIARGITSTMTAEVMLDRNIPFVAEFDVQKFPIEVFTRAYAAETAKISGLIGGKFEVEGAFRPAKVNTASGALDFIQLDVAGLKLQQARPVDIALKNNVVEIRDLLLVGEETQIALSGKIYPQEKVRLDLTLSADVGLQILSLWDRSITAGGNSTTRVAINGTLDQPSLQGLLEIRDGNFRHESLPNSLTDISALVTFKNRSITLESLKSVSSGGTLTAGGSATIKGVSLDQYRFDVYAERVRVHYPEGLRSTVSGEIHIQKQDQESHLTGDIEVLQGIYTRSFEESPDVFRYSRVPTFAGLTASPGAFSDVRLNIRIRSEGNLLVRNNFANMETEADLNVTGSINDPVLTGRVEVKRGDINFREREYKVVRGSLDFSNPYRTEAQLNFVAETRIREYLINLTFSGTFDRIYHDITSDPPLPRDDLYTLLGVGNTPDQIQGVNMTALVAGEEISRFITSPIASPLERGFRKVFGLQRFHITPTYVQSTEIATARITLEKDISRDLSFTYSTNLFTVAEEVFLFQYQLTDQIQVTASKDEQDRYGIDVLVTKTFE